MENFYAILRVSRGATNTEIRMSYLKLARECHPDRFFQDGKWILTNERFALINEAYRILSDEEKRRSYDEELRHGKESEKERTQKIQGENSFRNGLQEFNRENYGAAFRFFESAWKLNSDEPRYKSYGGLAMAKMGRRLNEALAFCEEAVEKEVYKPDLYVNLGLVYCLAGFQEKGRKKIQEALRWDPNNSRAIQELEKEKRKGGWLNKIFKRR